MMKRVLILTYLYLLSLTLTAQINLIPNNSFERFDSCYKVLFDSSIFIGEHVVIVDSIYPKFGLVELNNLCIENIPYAAFNGDSYIDFNSTAYNSQTNQFRNIEQATVLLKDFVTPSNWYYLEYMIRVRNENVNQKDSFRNTGVYFTNILDYTSVGTPSDSPIHFFDTTTIINLDAWQKVSGCFQVDSIYRYMVGFNLANDDYYPSLGHNDDFFSCKVSIDQVTLSPIDTFIKVNIPIDTVCIGDCIELSCNYSLIDATFDWDLPGSDYEGQDTGYVMVCYDTLGIYDVGLNVDHCVGNYGKIKENAITVVLPALQIAPDYQLITIIEGEEIEIGCADGGNVQWSPTTGLTINGITAIANDMVEENVLYSCIYGDTSQCGFECQYMFEILHYPEAIFEISNTEVCDGDCITIVDESSFTQGTFTYVLEGQDTIFMTQTETAELCPDVGIYTLFLMVSNSVGFDTIVETIEVLPYPEEINAQDNSIVAQLGDTIQLINPYEGLPVWITSIDNLDCTTCDTVQLIINTSGTVGVTSYVYENCPLQQTFEIHIDNSCNAIFLPTAFTPNNDGLNDTWRIYHPKGIKVLKTTIFNRWGAIVYVSDAEDPSWTGIYNGKITNMGVYIVKVDYVENGIEKTITGDITLYL